MGQTFSSFTPPSFVHNTPGELTHFDRSWPSPPRSSTPFISFNLFTREVVNIHPVRHSSSLLCHRPRPFSRITDPDWQSDDEDLIPKPTGAAGHPGNGGYKLSKALNWQGKDYYRFRVRCHSISSGIYNIDTYSHLATPQEFVREAACAHLDTDKNLRSQSRAALRLVKEEVSFYFIYMYRIFQSC